MVLTVLQPYGFNAEDLLHVVRGLRSLLHGYVDLEIAGGFGLALDRDESYRQLVRTADTGLAHAANASDGQCSRLADECPFLRGESVVDALDDDAPSGRVRPFQHG